MLNIALWGYGSFGKASLYDLENYCADDYRVMRVYDKSERVQGTQAGNVAAPIASPDGLVGDFKAGVFQKVMVCINVPDVLASARRFLADNGIPELCLGSLDDFCPASEFAQHPGPVSIDQEGYKLWTFTDLCGALPNYWHDETMYLFDRQGRVLKEHWDAHYIAPELSQMLSFPFPFGRTDHERVRMEGSWCVLPKMYANNYWHFAYENMDCVTLLEEAGFTGRYLISDSPSNLELMKLAGISPDRIVQLKDLEQHTVYEFDEVCYPKVEGPQQKRLRLSGPPLARMGERIAAKLPTDRPFPKRLYVKRIGKRKLLNADELAQEFGFETMVPEDYTIAEQMAFYRNADIVLAAHGANNVSSLTMRKNSVLVEVFPARWHPNCFFDVLREKGVRYVPVCELVPVTSFNDGMSRDFKIYPRLLREAIENAIVLQEHFSGK